MSQIVERVWQAKVTDRGVRAAFIAGRVSGSAGVTDHAALTNLSYAASGHTGFAPLTSPLFLVHATITVASPGNGLDLISTSSLSEGARIKFFHNSSSPAANDAIGALEFDGRSDIGSQRSYADLSIIIEDPTDGAEDGAIWVSVARNGSITSAVKWGATENVINDDGQSINFRIEGVGRTHSLFHDAANGFWGINNTTPVARWHVATGSKTSVGMLIDCASGQTASPFSIRDFNGVVVASISGAGVITAVGSGLTSLDAANIATNTVPTARLGSGTADATTYLRGDSTWQPITSGAAWGAITGTLSNQTDLNTALGLKASLDSPPFTGSPTSTGQWNFVASTKTDIPVRIRGTTSQTGDLLQLRNIANTATIAKFNANGSLYIVGASGEFPIIVRNTTDAATVFSVVNTTGACVTSGNFESATAFRANAFGVYYGVLNSTRLIVNSGYSQLIDPLEFAQVAAGGTVNSNCFRIYGKDVAGTCEGFVKDEGGFETQFSPHAFDAPDTMYDSPGTDRLPMIGRHLNVHLGFVGYHAESRQLRRNQDVLYALFDCKTYDQFRTQALAGIGKRENLQLIFEETFNEHNIRRSKVDPNHIPLVEQGWEDAEDERDIRHTEARNKDIELFNQWNSLVDPIDKLVTPQPVIRSPRIRKQMPKFLRDRNAHARKN